MYEHIITTVEPAADPWRADDCTCDDPCVWDGSWIPAFDKRWGLWNLVAA